MPAALCFSNRYATHMWTDVHRYPMKCFVTLYEKSSFADDRLNYDGRIRCRVPLKIELFKYNCATSHEEEKITRSDQHSMNPIL